MVNHGPCQISHGSRRGDREANWIYWRCRRIIGNHGCLQGPTNLPQRSGQLPTPLGVLRGNVGGYPVVLRVPVSVMLCTCGEILLALHGLSPR